jgi:hypothetical protein
LTSFIICLLSSLLDIFPTLGNFFFSILVSSLGLLFSLFSFQSNTFIHFFCPFFDILLALFKSSFWLLSFFLRFWGGSHFMDFLSCSLIKFLSTLFDSLPAWSQGWCNSFYNSWLFWGEILSFDTLFCLLIFCLNILFQLFSLLF